MLTGPVSWTVFSSVLDKSQTQTNQWWQFTVLKKQLTRSIDTIESTNVPLQVNLSFPLFFLNLHKAQNCYSKKRKRGKKKQLSEKRHGKKWISRKISPRDFEIVRRKHDGNSNSSNGALKARKRLKRRKWPCPCRRWHRRRNCHWAIDRRRGRRFWRRRTNRRGWWRRKQRERPRSPRGRGWEKRGWRNPWRLQRERT